MVHVENRYKHKFRISISPTGTLGNVNLVKKGLK